MPKSSRFCPLLSTSINTVNCSDKCMWHVPSDTDYTCAIPLVLSTQGTVIDVLKNSPKKDLR